MQQLKSNKFQKELYTCMKMVSLIGILNLKMLLCQMGRANCVILGGRLFVTKGEKHIVVRLIMLHHKFYKAHNMICQLTFGVWV